MGESIYHGGMSWFLVIVGVALLLLIPTAYAGLIGAPYAPTRKQAIDEALDRIGLDAEALLVDLGAGDGKVLLAAHARGARAIGYELSPLLWAVSTWRCMGKRGLRVRWRNFFRQTLPSETTHIFVFLMPQHMAKVRSYIASQELATLQFVLSYSFPFPDINPLHVVQTKTAGRVFIYDARDIQG